MFLPNNVAYMYGYTSLGINLRIITKQCVAYSLNERFYCFINFTTFECKGFIDPTPLDFKARQTDH